MIIADWVAIGLSALFCIIGFITGFGRGLKFFTSGIFGFLISILVCYAIGGLVLHLGFVQELLGKLIEVMTNVNGFCDFLISISIDVIIFYIALFIIVTIIRIIIVQILKHASEAENVAIKFVNRTLGIFLFAAALALTALTAFQIISLIGGEAAENFASLLVDSKLKLDKLFEFNPLVTLINAAS